MEGGTDRKRWDVITIREREGSDKKYWMKIGTAFVNRDGSFNLFLDAMPLDGKLHVREHKEFEEKHQAGNGAGAVAEPRGNDARRQLRGKTPDPAGAPF